MTWIIQQWKLISSIAVVVGGVVIWTYKARKARADALAAESLRRREEAVALQVSSAVSVDKEVLQALANTDLWKGPRPMTGGGVPAVRAAEIATHLRLQVDLVADSLERLENDGKVREHGGTLDNPAPYWTIVRRW